MGDLPGGIHIFFKPELAMRLICILSIALAAMLGSTAALAKTYVAGVEPSFPPWASVDHGKLVGIAPDAVRAIAKQQGFDVKFRSMSFSSLIPALKAGKIDMLVTGLTVTPKRAQQIDFTVPWWQIKLDVLVPRRSKLTAKTALSNGHDDRRADRHHQLRLAEESDRGQGRQHQYQYL